MDKVDGCYLAGGNTPPGGQNDGDISIGKGVDAKKCTQYLKYKRLKSGSIDRLRDKATNVTPWIT